MNLTEIKAAASAKQEIEIKTEFGTFRGVPRISWVDRTVTLKQANGCKSVVEFDDIPGL